MKKYLRNLLVLLLCPVLLYGAFAALAEEVEFELDDSLVPEVESMDGEILMELELPNLLMPSEEEMRSPDNPGNVSGMISNDLDDFIIDNGVLTRYWGYDSAVTIPDGVTAIGDGAFAGCTLLTSIVIPDSVTSIGNRAFFSCTGLTSIVIPDSVTSIGHWAFRQCEKMTQITIGKGVTSIGDGAFQLTSLTSVVVPDNVTSLGVGVFSHITTLTSVEGLAGVASMGEDVFAFTGLNSIKLKEGLRCIGVCMFFSCKNLTEVSIPDSVKIIDKASFMGTGLKSVTIPGNVDSIGEEAFENCEDLSTVVIQNGLTSIGDLAFAYDPLTDVTIPPTVISIGEDAFSWGGTDIVIHGEAGSYAEEYAEEYEFDFDDGTTSISITNGASAELELDSTLQLITEVTPSNPKVKRIWTSSDKKIATVSADGLVTGIAKGKATITVTTKNGKKDSIEINVVAPQPTRIAITNGKTISVDVDSKKQLNVKLTPANAETTLTWTSSDKSIATVSAKGLVKGVKKGSATITVTTRNGKTASIKVKVVAPVPTKVIINQGKSATLYMGSTLKLTTKLAPAKAESKLTWSSSKPAVATVSSKGVVTPKKAGKTKITVKTANGKKASITVKVVDVQSVKLKEGKSKTLKVGKKLALHATVSPKQVKTRLTWSSSNPKVAAVSGKGVVTAKKAGSAKITVKTANGKSATITITVK